MIHKLSLNGVWQWRDADGGGYRPGTVPGSVLCDMLREGLIDDPFWRMNEYATRELMGKDYEYRRSFSVGQDALCADSIHLVCEGLDTIASVRLNGRLLAETDDMHRTYRLNAGGYLRAGENEISVLFSSPLRFVRREHLQSDIHYASTGSIHGNAALRKAHYMFGWDWGPQLPDAGIFRDIFLEFAGTARLADVRIRQYHRQNAGVTLSVCPAAEVWGCAESECEAELTVTGPAGERFCAKSRGAPFAPLEAVIAEPKLWWPNGLGAQPLYTVETALLVNGVRHDTHRCRVGLRTVTVSTGDDEWGNEFCFVVNGRKVFAMGANYIPQDSLIPRVTPESCRRLVAQSAEANFNCLRVWGGGYYPDDAFYDACDEYGILVWQDLMFACNVYALNGRFEENIVCETRDNVRRLRHRACLALWCGNNEMEWGWGEGWQRIQGHHPRYKADYLKIFEMVLPRALRDFDDQTFFWPSSPSSGGAYDFPNDPDRGDKHYWDVWHSGKPFTEYRSHHFRFCSEYGFQSFPHIKTLRSFTLPQDRNIFSEVMESHQKNGAANSKIFAYISDYYLYPKNLDCVAYISQILQLRAVQYGVEHWRRNRGRCMGSLYWQLNDCWPVASWASIDYCGRWKALHYGAKRFYAPVAASACERKELDTQITYYVHNDTLTGHTLTLTAELVDTAFHILHSAGAAVNAKPLSAAPVLEVDFAPYIQDGEHRRRVFARYRLQDGAGTVISEGVTLFVKPKHFHYPRPSYAFDIKDEGESYLITVKASGFSNYTEVYFTETDCVLSDNFFDITDGGGRCLRLQKDRLSQNVSAGELARQTVIRSIADTYQLGGSDDGME